MFKNMQTKKIIFSVAVILFLSRAMALAQTFTKNITATFSVDPVTSISVTALDGGTGVDFGNISSYEKGSTITRNLEVSVVSNTGNPYKVTQKIEGSFTDDQGNSLPPDICTFHLLPSGNTKGRLEVVSPTVVSGENVLFTSTEDGASDKFIIVYELKLPGLFKAGNYLTSITFTLS